MLYYNIEWTECFGWFDVGAIGMKWFRSNIRYGSRLALLALAMQFVFSFGHFHGLTAQAAAATVQSNATQADVSFGTSGTSQADAAAEPAVPPGSSHDRDQRSHDPCAICAVMALANAALFGTPPILLLPQAVELLYHISDSEFIHLNSARVAFQPRAPPAS